MYKKLIYLVSFVLMLGLVSNASAQPADGQIQGAWNAPVIDGKVDAIWYGALAHPIDQVVVGDASSIENERDFSAWWKALWDSTRIYFLVDVNDAELIFDSPGSGAWPNMHNDDAVEVHIDADNSKGSTYATDDFQYGFRWNDPDTIGTGGNSNTDTTGVEFVIVEKTDPPGYICEISVPWSTLLTTPGAGDLIGVNVGVNDDDDGGSRDYQLTWLVTSGDQWLNPSLFPTMELIAALPQAKSSSPSPHDGAKGVPQEVALTWRPGVYVEGLSPRHRVFFSENFDDVNDGIGGIEQDVERYPIDGSLKLDLGKTCYWRVDEANSTTPGWDVGTVWRFTVIDHLVVDDFEDYNDFSPDIIYEAWLDGWEVEANGSTVGYPAPPAAEQNTVHGGKQSMPLFYDNSGTANYSEAERAFSPAQDWTREDVGILSLWFRGHPAYVGSFTEGPTGTYTMTASGEDIWSNSDQFHFAWKEVSGATSISAKVESVENTDPFAKAGVMIRDTLDADSANAALLITPENGVRFQFRNTTGGSTNRFFMEGITAPQWVKLERTVGGLVRAYYSADGNTWTQLNLTTVAMNTPMYIGLALTSHDTALTCEAKFSNVTSDGTGQWVNQDIGMLSNEAEPMYVFVEDGSGTSATVYHDDSNAALIDTWTEWNIDLQEFSNAGVVLTDVSSLSIGFGSADNPQPGGSGLVFFDDIRLYLDSLLPSVITISPVDTFEATGDNGTIVSINGVAVADLILGTTTFAGDPMHASFPPEDADNFDLSVGASADDQAYVQTVFAMPVTTIFIIEKGGNDIGYMQSLDENGDPLDEPTPFLPADFKDTGLTGVQDQKVAAAVIALEVPVYGIRILPPDDKALGFDPTSVSGVPAQ